MRKDRFVLFLKQIEVCQTCAADLRNSPLNSPPTETVTYHMQSIVDISLHTFFKTWVEIANQLGFKEEEKPLQAT